jgi:hypothetical protein
MALEAKKNRKIGLSGVFIEKKKRLGSYFSN